MIDTRVRLCRLIRPANPQGRVNVYSPFTKRTTTLGLVVLATVINKFKGWRVEVIDEENYHGKRDKDGLPDHEALQQDAKADVVGFYCGLTSTIERVWQLADFYKEQGAITLAGSWHAHYCPKETLGHNIDLVVHGDAEIVIEKVFANIDDNQPLHKGVGGVSYLDGEQVRHILPNLQDAGQLPDCDARIVSLENALTCEELTQLPYPDFGLLLRARIRIYPVGRIRGCSMKCKFCTVKTNPHWASAKWLFGFVDWLVKTRNAKEFFLVDDRSEEDLPGTLEFLEKVADKYGNALRFTVQIRLEAAKNTKLLAAMKKAGVRSVCIGLESPIAEELNAMKKALSAKEMLELLSVWRRYMTVHGMFIFGFPVPGLKMSIAQRIHAYKDFIRKARLGFVQVMMPIPLPGSELYREYQADGRLFPLSVAPWNKYDGNSLLLKPEEGVNIREVQAAHASIMAWFYHRFRFYAMVFRTLAFPLDYILRGWESWNTAWRRDAIRWVGHRIVRRWFAAKDTEKHLRALEKYLDSKE